MKDKSQKHSLLIVDDEPNNVKILNEFLRNNYNIRVATTGERALLIAASENPPDLILLDVVLPGIDGYEVCKRLKSQPDTKDIPIIFITAKLDEQDEVKGFEAGAVDYVTKPFSSVVVEARVRTHVELKIKTEMLRNKSLYDGLTGIPNRRNFDEYLELMWNYGIRDSSPLSLIMIDIDYFKMYNDNYGHQAGDECLISVAKCLEASLRRKIDVVARYGGEEFACILPKTNIEGATLIADKFQSEIQALKIPHVLSSVSSIVTISQGVSTIIPSKNNLKEDLIKIADQRLYKAKESGRNRYSILDF